MFYLPLSDPDYRESAIIDISRERSMTAADEKELKQTSFSYYQNSDGSAAFCRNSQEENHNLAVVPQFSESGIQYQVTGFLSQGGDPIQTRILSTIVSDALKSQTSSHFPARPAAETLVSVFKDINFKGNPPEFALAELGFNDKWQHAITVTRVGKLCIWIGDPHLQTKQIISGKDNETVADFLKSPDKYQITVASSILQPGDYCVILPEEALTTSLHQTNLTLADEASCAEVLDSFRKIIKPEASAAVLVMQIPNPQKELIRALICQPEHAPRILREMAFRKHLFSEIAVMAIIQELKKEVFIKDKKPITAVSAEALFDQCEDDASFELCLSQKQLNYVEKSLPNLIQYYFELDGLIQNQSSLTLYSKLVNSFWRIINKLNLDEASLLFSAITVIPEVTGYSYGYFYNSCATDWPSCCERIQALALGKFAGVYQRLANDPEKQVSFWNECLSLPIFAFNHSIHYFARLANSTVLNRLQNLDLPSPLEKSKEVEIPILLSDFVEDLRSSEVDLNTKLTALSTLIHYKHRIPEMLPIVREYCEIDRIIRRGKALYSELERAFNRALEIFSFTEVNLLFCATKVRPAVTGFTTGMMWSGNSHEWITCCQNIQAAAKKKLRTTIDAIHSSTERNAYLSTQHGLEIFGYDPQTNSIVPSAEILKQLTPSVRYIRLI